jgi:lipid II:glycine glycyltransferase (peptidoglycan interpeptide bridge formation enzyme)
MHHQTSGSNSYGLHAFKVCFNCQLVWIVDTVLLTIGVAHPTLA